MKKQPNQPIVLSGRVFFDGFLAEVTEAGRTAGASRPAVLLPGDIKLHNVNKGGTRPRFGQDVSFDGFISAGVYDGKRFGVCCCVSTPLSMPAIRAPSLVATRLTPAADTCSTWAASALSGWTRTAAIRSPTRTTAPVLLRSTCSCRGQPTAAEKPTTPAAVSAAVDLSPAPVAVATSTTTAADKPVATPAVHKPVKRRTRRRKVNPNQLDMFGGK
jgi:hypothetical protein